MKAPELSAENLRREIYSLRRELRKDIREVREAAKTDVLIPKTAVRQMTDVERIMRNKSVKDMSESQLRSVYRKLSHIRGLKTSTKSGAEATVTHLTEIIPNIRNLSKSQISKLWTAYDKLIEQAGVLKQFKYEVYGALADVISKTRISTDELAIRVEEIYDLATRGELDEDEYTDKTTKLLIQSFKAIL